MGACWDNDRVREKRGSGLTGFRRYTWWAVPGSTAFLLVLFVGDWIFDPDVRFWARTAALAALIVTVPATVVLLGRRISGDRMPRGWLIAGSLGAVARAQSRTSGSRIHSPTNRASMNPVLPGTAQHV